MNITQPHNSRITLTQYIDRLNAETQKWLDENPGSFAGMLTNDTEHWAGYNVHTAEDLEKYLLVVSVYEGTKDMWGYKPNWGDLMKKDTEELLRMSKELDMAATKPFNN